MKVIIVVAIVVVFLAIGLGSLSSSSSSSNSNGTSVKGEVVTRAAPTTVPATPNQAMVIGLCASLLAANSGDAQQAKNDFYDTAHQRLHELASETIAVDRQAAATMLQSKERVEADLENSSPKLSTDMIALISATATAIGATGGTETPPC